MRRKSSRYGMMRYKEERVGREKEDRANGGKGAIEGWCNGEEEVMEGKRFFLFFFFFLLRF